jgi:hypothetical protein
MRAVASHHCVATIQPQSKLDFLVDGFIRLEACRELGFDVIEARTYTGGTPGIEVQTMGQICRDRAA